MIIRIWHGWTMPANAGTYETLLKTEIFPGIAAKQIKGYRGIELLRRETAGEVEFITMMRFDSLQAVKDFQGEDYETAYVPEKARQMLSRFDERSQHYEIKETLRYAALGQVEYR
jgi:heme-degrading monooxygenase HmoA